MSLTSADLAAELSRYTYRPGWALLFEQDPLEGPCLWVVTSQPDSNDPARRVPLNIRSLIPPRRSPAGFCGVCRSWRSTKPRSGSVATVFRSATRTATARRRPADRHASCLTSPRDVARLRT